MKFALFFLFLCHSAFSEIPLDRDFHRMLERDFYETGHFKKWIDKHYKDLVRLKVPGLKPREHYDKIEDKKKDWIAKRAQERIEEDVRRFYQRMDAKIEKTVGTYYYRKGKNNRLVLIVPVPHLAYPSEYPGLLGKIYNRYPEDHIIYLQNIRFIQGDKFRDEKELARVLREEILHVYKEWKLGGLEKNYFVICNATPYVTSFLTQSKDLYDRAIFFSPMVSNLDKGRLFKAGELHPGEKTFNVFDLFYIYFVILKNEPVLPLYWSMKEFFNLNLPTYDYFMGLYDKGLDLSQIKPKYVIVGEVDPLVTPRNSTPLTFDSHHVIKGGDHLSPLNEQLDELLGVMERYMNRKDKR